MKKEHDHNEWGNIGNPEDFNKSNYVYSKTKAMRKAQSKRNKDPEWRAKIIHANNNWSEERKAAYENRDKSYLDKNSEWYKDTVKRNAKSRIPVQIKKPDSEWVKFNSVRDFAATTEDAKLFENKAENGKMMFIYQAHQSFTIWHKKIAKIDDETIKILD